ncbi:ABC transporter substrate-binding protein [Leptolyngbya sp. AN02str]|uniref:ABC transporter substrate-binding protein n=1 Tax=Leptolyngbya sp. AN02str TaxID=3423363 RepID=UPI003D313C4C
MSLLVTMGLLGVGSWWSVGQLNGIHLQGLQRDNTSQLSRAELEAVRSHMSQGERLLLEDGVPPEKRAGVWAYQQGNYTEAATNFQLALLANPNDPEARIYASNAAIGNDNAYTLAVVVSLSGDRTSALEVLRGVAQAQYEVNQRGGIGGVPLKLAIANDANQPELAMKLAATLGNDTSILGVVGHATTETTLAALPHYEAAGLVTIAPLSTAIALTNRSQYLFRTVPSDFVTARALADHALNRMRHQRVALFFSDQSADSQSLKNELSTALALGGGQVVLEANLADDGFSPVASFNHAVEAGASALMLLPDSAQIDRALQLVRGNAGRLALLAGGELYTVKTLEISGPDAVGLVSVVPWHALSNPRSPFAATARTLWRGEVSWRTAVAFDAVQALAAALERSPSRLGVQAELSTGRSYANGATGTIRFLPSGDRNQSVQLVEVQPGLRSGYGYDFVPLGFGSIVNPQEALGMLP